MKRIIIILISAICFLSCIRNKTIDADPSKTTVAEMTLAKQDTATYKVIVDKDKNISVYDKYTNLKVYESKNVSGEYDWAIWFALIFGAILMIRLVIEILEI